jgi:RNA polymerase sigma factor (sigma-70 family)
MTSRQCLRAANFPRFAIWQRPAVRETSGSVSADAEVEAFWAGQVARLERIYREHRRSLERVATRYVGAAEAESVLQDVFVEVIRSAEMRRRFTGGSLGAWLAEVTRRKALEHLRRTRRPIPAEAEQPASTTAEPVLLARDLVQRFVAAHVPSEQHRFFMLRFLERRTQVEVAGELGIPRSTLEGWEHRLAERLRRFVLEG